jgi:glycosyltransferase involved in cell wall biosynthesis
MSRAARERRVFFVEEPVFDGDADRLELHEVAPSLITAVPHLRRENDRSADDAQRVLLDELRARFSIRAPIRWFYNPLALAFARHVNGGPTVYDCMDELTGFKGAHPELGRWEADLPRTADVVFTGGQSLYEAKRHRHANVHAFPSSVDREHFARARSGEAVEPEDQAHLPRPRIGYFGVIDERMDLELLAGLAEAQPERQVVMIGPVVKIDPASLPRRRNLHYLGQKRYEELPSYIAGWDVAILPFALNDATRFISPTKTLEYMAAGRTIVSTPIRDVVRPYGERGLVRIADRERFADAVEAALEERGTEAAIARQSAADAWLAGTSWDRTWSAMDALIRRLDAA